MPQPQRHPEPYLILYSDGTIHIGDALKASILAQISSSGSVPRSGPVVSKGKPGHPPGPTKRTQELMGAVRTHLKRRPGMSMRDLVDKYTGHRYIPEDTSVASALTTALRHLREDGLVTTKGRRSGMRYYASMPGDTQEVPAPPTKDKPAPEAGRKMRRHLAIKRLIAHVGDDVAKEALRGLSDRQRALVEAADLQDEDLHKICRAFGMGEIQNLHVALYDARCRWESAILSSLTPEGRVRALLAMKVPKNKIPLRAALTPASMKRVERSLKNEGIMLE